MSKNWYAEIKVAADETTPVINFHIGKTNTNSVSVDGNLFGSFADMVSFLRYNESKTSIVDEYGVNYSLDELIEIFYAYPLTDRSRQSRVDGTDTVQDVENFSISKGVWF